MSNKKVSVKSNAQSLSAAQSAKAMRKQRQERIRQVEDSRLAALFRSDQPSAAKSRQSGQESVNMLGSNLSKCAQEYAASIANPFADGPDGACIPDAPALMTRRTKVWSKGTFSTSTNAGALGTGYCVLDPLAAIASDRFCVYTNDPARTAASINISTVGQYVGHSSQSEYLTADVSSTGIQPRVVSAGLKIRNISSTLNKGGFIVGLHEPAHVCLDGYDIPTMDLYLEAGDRLSANSKEFSVLTYRPVDSTDLDWVEAFPAVNPSPGQANMAYMGFIVQSPDSAGMNPQLYEYEAFVNFEVQGQRALGKIASHADPQGYAAVNAMTVFAKKLHSPHQDNPQHISSAFVEGSEHYLNNHMSHSKPAPPKKKKSGGSFWSDLLDVAPSIIGGIASLF